MLAVRPIQCPYCGETIDLLVDGSIEHQRYLEDCAVCCRPINIEVRVDPDERIDVSCWTEDDA